MRYILFCIFCLQISFALQLEKAKTYESQNIQGWIMSEKLDGIRAIWDGEKLISKNGNIIHTPLSFTKNFPPFFLDGELWSKRDDFENIQSIVLDKTPSTNWNQITYNIFEVPFEKGTFIERLQKAKKWFSQFPNIKVRFIPQIPCNNKQHLEYFLKQVISKKGEGIIIKNPNFHYIAKRHSKILKVKKFYDMEGKVIKINFNKNNHMKSLLIKLENKITFNLGGGFTQQERINHPKVGDTITFKYYGFSKNGKPKFASFSRVRKKE